MRRAALATLLLAALAPTARAQVEITPVAGYRFGGSLDTRLDGASRGDARLELDDAFSFGVHLGYAVGEGEVELIYARQETRLQSSALFAGEALFDLAVESWQLGGSYFFGDDGARVRPFVGVGLGLTRLLPEPAGLSDETRFSASFGAGAKLWLGRHLGLRLEARGFFTVLDGEGRGFCAEGSCAVDFADSQVISQADLRAGLILRF